MEPSTIKSLSEASKFIGVSRQTLELLISIRDPLSLEGKVEPKYFSSSGLS